MAKLSVPALTSIAYKGQITSTDHNTNYGILFNAITTYNYTVKAGQLIVNTNLLFTDDANARVGINTASPAVALDVVGGLNVSGAVNLSAQTATRVMATDGSKNLTGLTYGSSGTASSLVYLDGSSNFSAGRMTGAVTGNVTGNCTGSSGSCTGNSATATSATSATNSTQHNGVLIKSMTGSINVGGETKVVAHGLDTTKIYSIVVALVNTTGPHAGQFVTCTWDGTNMTFTVPNMSGANSGVYRINIWYLP